MYTSSRVSEGKAGARGGGGAGGATRRVEENKKTYLPPDHLRSDVTLYLNGGRAVCTVEFYFAFMGLN